MMATGQTWRRASTRKDRMSDGDLSDELCRLSQIAAALYAAIEGADNDALSDQRQRGGILWIADGFSQDLAALVEAFDQERTLRRIDAEIGSKAS